MSVQFELAGDVAVVTMDRPDRFNAIEASLGDGLVRALERASEEARAAILTGAGRAFCAGADLADLRPQYEEGGGPDLTALLDDVFHPALEAILDCRVPVIGAVNGVAAGAGMGLALACDLRVLSEDAFFTSAFTAIGLIPDTGTTWWLSHHLGVSRALELALTNRRLSAAETLDLGLCLDVVPGDQLLDRSLELAGQMADLVPDSLVTARRLIRRAASSSLEDAMKAERAEQGRLGKTPEHREGVIAFLEKRKPDFRDR